MTRRSQVVRSSRSNGPSATRPFPGGATIWCADQPCAESWMGLRTILSIPVVAQDPFQRFYISATVTDVQAWWEFTNNQDNAYIDLWADGFGFIASVALMGGGAVGNENTNFGRTSAVVTGAVDLPGGEYSIGLRMGPETWDNWVATSGRNMQVIEGQIVEQPGCPGNRPT